MTWVILAILIGIAFWIGVGMITLSKNPDTKAGGLLVTGGAVLVFVVLSFFMSIHTVGQRQVGIVYNFSGTITGTTGSGVVFTAPWQHITKENVGVQRENFSLNETNSAVSSDQQAIFASLALNYQVSPVRVLGLYRTVGPQWKAILLDARVLQDFKEVTSGFTAQQITTQREALRAQTRKRLEAELSKYDINIVDFFVTNLSYTRTYQDSINAKNVQVQQALQAEAKVKQAEAEARQQVALAKGQAEAISAKGKALHNNPEVLQLEAIDKLSPNASVIICTGQTCPSFLPQAVGATSTKK